MSSKFLGKVIELREGLYKGIIERRRIRTRCLELQDELDDVLYQASFIDAEDRDLSYLHRNAHDHCVKADSLIREHSRPVHDEYFHHEPDTIDDENIAEVKSHLKSAIQSIDRYNLFIIWGTRGLFVSAVLLLIAILVVQLPFQLF